MSRDQVQLEAQQLTGQMQEMQQKLQQVEDTMLTNPHGSKDMFRGGGKLEEVLITFAAIIFAC